MHILKQGLGLGYDMGLGLGYDIGHAHKHTHAHGRVVSMQQSSGARNEVACSLVHSSHAYATSDNTHNLRGFMCVCAPSCLCVCVYARARARVGYHGTVANEVHLGVFAHDRLEVANGSIPH